MYKMLFMMLAIFFANVVFADEPYKACKDDPARQEVRSKELQEIVKADQDDRSDEMVKDWLKKGPEVAKRDVIRRKRVGEIFGEGCFSTAQDYAAAALVFQHGDTPDHFFQTYIWSKRGMELGDKNQGQMMANGIDRYLVNIGHKTLFASQAFMDGTGANACWCLQPVEPSFPERLRIQIKQKSLRQSFDWLDELNHHRKECPLAECKGVKLKPTPKGTVPGLW